MANVPALAAARQAAIAPSVNALFNELSSRICTVPVEPFGFQVTVTPLERVTVAFGAKFGPFVSLGDGGIVNVALKGPTSAPPLPLTVKVPGTRNVPAVLREMLLSVFAVRFILPFGP